MKAKRIYPPGLNALRFFAVTLVILHYLEQYKSWGNHKSLWGRSLIDALVYKPVSLFFVLSGFLITYLLLEVNRDKQSINIKQFYLKRICGIWPLYFLVVIIALTIIPMFSGIAFGHMPSPNSPILLISLILILPNLLRVSFPTLIGANQLWSVGIEGQFYLIWPLLVKRFEKNIIAFLFVFIFLKIAVHMLMLYGLSISSAPWLMKLEMLYALFPVEQMAAGALGASFLFYKKESILKYMEKPYIGLLALVLIIGDSFMYLGHFLAPMIEGILLMIIIYQVTIHKRIYKPLENSALDDLGSISFGIYIWHTFAITISITAMKVLDWNSSLTVCLLNLAITLLPSHLSYKYLGKPAQKLRSYFIVYRETITFSTTTNA
ncbi:MAG: peptidoglycan/LPS O-acetylase OafA/YrhL [Cyclobacteriaceae bacterium]|jgi:peptidoglycan/LPS O-acetylase OafA/YrhL